MMNLSLTNIVLFMGITWGTNISLNLLYVLKRFIPRVVSFDMPIDWGVNFFDRKRLFGDSTTVLGVLVSVLCSTIAFYSGFFNNTVALLTPILVYGGHLVGSFIKRRMDSNTFLPFVDHGDYVFLSGLVLCLCGLVSVKLALVCLLLTYILHPIAVVIAFRLGLREQSY